MTAVRELREQANITASELARRAAVSRRQLVRIELGELGPTVRTAARICDALGLALGRHITIDEVFREEGGP